MKQELKSEWEKEWTETEQNPYARAIVKTADKVMQYLDEGADVDTHALVLRADEELKEGLTGNMAAYAVHLVVKYHEKGADVAASWNGQYGHPEERMRVINPATVELSDEAEARMNQPGKPTDLSPAPGEK